MDVTDLGRTDPRVGRGARASRERARAVRSPALGMLGIGTALFAASRLLSIPLLAPSPPATFERARDPEDLLVEAALAQDLARHDLVVRQQLLDDLRATFATAESNDDTLVEQAIALGLDRSDSIVRRRLANLMRLRAESAAWTREPAPDEVAARLAVLRAHEVVRERMTIEHVFFDRARYDVTALAEILSRTRRALEQSRVQVAEAGDPHPLPARTSSLSAEEIAARLGERVAHALAAAETGRWVGPVSDATGDHLVRVVERHPAPSPSDELLREHARRSLRAEAAEKAHADAITSLRAASQPESAPIAR